MKCKMKRIIIAIIYIIPISLYAQYVQSDSLDIWTEEGITAFKNNNYKEALKYFEYCTKDYERQQVEDDAARTAFLQKVGYSVLRFTNEQVLYDIDNVIQQIRDFFDKGIILNNGYEKT